MVRSILGGLSALLLATVMGLCGCDAATRSSFTGEATDGAARTGVTPPSPSPVAEIAPVGDSAPLRIASFNIQVFGTSKMDKPDVMAVLVQVVRRFDLVSIQEVRSVDETILPRFVEMLNADGARYDFVIGPRLGRTSSKEQYAVVFDTARVAPVPGCLGTVSDPDDLLHREPLVARFRAVGEPPETAFTFDLMTIHTDPDETDTEIAALADVYLGVRQSSPDEDDLILLGDLNVDEYHLGRLAAIPGMTHVVTGTTTNTRRTQMYDNILFVASETAEYTGRWGVFDLMAECGLTEEQALKVSDHLPVWAEFSASESGPAGSMATRPALPPR